MRGKESDGGQQKMIGRITPAYAGKSTVVGGLLQYHRDHPRLCGEKYATINIDKMHKGSPPPMRGKGGYNSRHYDQYRITPAYAGKSQAGSLSHKRIEDHPRLCGEKSIFPLSKRKT